MKKIIKILTLCVVMVFAMSISVFSATKNEDVSSLKLKNGTVIKVEKDFNGKVKSIQFPNEGKVELKNIQLMFNVARKECFKKATNAFMFDACGNAKVAAGIATAAAGVACIPGIGTGLGCAVASAAAIWAVKIMHETCGSSYMDGPAIALGPDEIVAKSKKLPLARKNKFHFQT